MQYNNKDKHDDSLSRVGGCCGGHNHHGHNHKDCSDHDNFDDLDQAEQILHLRSDIESLRSDVKSLATQLTETRARMKCSIILVIVFISMMLVSRS